MDSRERVTSHTDREFHFGKVYRVSANNECYHLGWSCPELKAYGDIEQMHQTGVSVITLLENLAEQEANNAFGGHNA